MTLRGILIVGVVLVGTGLVGVTGRAVLAQAGPKVAAQIIPADQEDEFIKGAVLAKTPGVVVPKAIRQINPKYTASALRAKIAGDVKIQAVIGVDGRVEKSRVKESLDPELDAEALKALDQWEFEPGRMNGQPARVLIEVEMTFRVR